MTANEMKDNFLRLYDKNFQLGAPQYDETGISQYLTDAQLVIFKDEYIPKNGVLGFEATEKIRRDLADLVKYASVSEGTISASSSQTGAHSNGTLYDVPDNFQWAASELVTLTGVSRDADVLPVTNDFYSKNRGNKYKKLYDKLVWRMDFSRVDTGSDGGDSYADRTNQRIELITDGTAITNYKLWYISTLPDIVVDEITTANQRHCILDESLHYDVVLMAVKMATGATDIEEYSIANREQKENTIN